MTLQNNTTRRAMNLIFFPFLLVILCCGSVQGYKYLHRNDWKKTTTPLPQNRVDILCKNFGLDKSHELCNEKKDVYGPDFYGIIRDTFRPKLTYRAADDIPATYEQVERIIGVFKTECEPIVWLAYEQKNYYRCFYDLRGDGEYLMSIGYYYPENIVYEITATTQKEPHDR